MIDMQFIHLYLNQCTLVIVIALCSIVCLSLTFTPLFLSIVLELNLFRATIQQAHLLCITLEGKSVFGFAAMEVVL